MCVGLRAKVANIENNMAVIDAGGVKRKVSAVHAGLAIARVAADEAAEADKVMEELNDN